MSVPANVGKTNLQNAVTRTQRRRDAPAAFRYREERAPPRSAMATNTQPISAAPRRSIPSEAERAPPGDRKSTRLNSSHVRISYAVFCLKKKKRIHASRLTHH